MLPRPAHLLLACVLVAGGASAQEGPRPERLYVNSETLLGSTRMVALGGAYVGIAEGADGFSSNLASLAQRSKDLDREWNLDFALSFVDVPLGNPAARDLDNDGAPDASLQSRQLLTGLALQYKAFGIGAYTRGSYLAYCLQDPCAPEDVLHVQLSSSALAAAIALHDDELILAAGFYNASASFVFQGQSALASATSASLDVLLRPRHLPFRLGAAFRPQLEARFQPVAGQGTTLADRRLFSAVVTPTVLSLGGSLRLGEGAAGYNRLSPAARMQALEGGHALDLAADPDEDAVARSWRALLVSVQLDAIFPVENATALSTFLAGTEPVGLGGRLALSPHLGAEHETLPGRLRTRLGIFLEPSPSPERLPRAHLTGGFELFVLRYLDDWSLSASFDVARRYSQVSVSIGFWR